jgi:hypothetical protein
MQDVVVSPGKMATKVEATERRVEDVDGKKWKSKRRGSEGNVMDRMERKGSNDNIFVTTEMTQDVKSKSEMGSEKDLIFQRN